MQPFGIQGRFIVGEETIEGQILGSEECSKFIVRRLDIPNKPKNPDGLLFKVIDREHHTLTDADCVKYAKWLASGELISLIMDFDNMRSVLGKDIYQWGEQDSLRLGSLGGICAKLVKNSTDLELINLSHKIRNWVPSSLKGGKFNWRTNTWVMMEQSIYIIQDARMFALRQLRDLKALPLEWQSLTAVDQAVEKVERKKEFFVHLDQKERDNHKSNLLTFRLELEGHIKAEKLKSAISRIDKFVQRADTLVKFDEFMKFENSYRQDMVVFWQRGYQDCVQELEAAFKQRVEGHANRLLTNVLAAKMQALSVLSDASCERLDEFKAIDKEISEIMQVAARHHLTRSPALEKSCQDYKDTFAKLLTNVLAAKTQALSVLSDASYERLDEFKAIDKEISEIMQITARHHLTRSPALEKSCQDYKDTFAKSYDDMIDRSSDDLVQWIEAHPPKEKALEELNEFSLSLFKVEWHKIPDRHANIRDAITELSNTIEHDKKAAIIAKQNALFKVETQQDITRILSEQQRHDYETQMERNRRYIDQAGDWMRVP